ncbi:MAG: hypothetical protein A4E50_00356 [Methanosaeta sp. PtaB.Bin087]|nr:MAG: hypothetical protein A4E50_00356 [Methanosaeta sp. PtaB.Bin087]
MASELNQEVTKSELMEKVAAQIENLHSKKFGEDHKINWYYYDDVMGEGDGKCAACGGKFTIRLKRSSAQGGD